MISYKLYGKLDSLRKGLSGGCERPDRLPGTRQPFVQPPPQHVKDRASAQRPRGTCVGESTNCSAGAAAVP
jgi:hypothetical protein